MSTSIRLSDPARRARTATPAAQDPGFMVEDEGPSISIVVPVYNGGEAFRRCAEAIAASLQPQDEFIVVADGESDRAWAGLAESEPRAYVLLNETNAGPAVSRNRGAEAATGDILLFLDADVVVPPDVLEKVRSAFETDQELDALMGSYDDAPDHPDFLSQYRNLLHHHTHQTGSEDASTFWAGCGAVRRDVFESIGGFEPGYRYPCVEDIELGYRLRSAGYRIQLRKDIQVKHLKAWTAKSIARTDLFYRAVPWTRLLLRKQTFENDLNINWKGRLSVAAVWSLPLAALISFWSSMVALLVAVGLVGSIVALNSSFYRFLLSRRGTAFALKALPWHVFYFAYSGLGFALGVLEYVLAPSEQTTSRVDSHIDSKISPCTISQLSSSVPAQQV